MRECPQCGFKDPPIWRSQSHKRYTDYCHKDELLYWNKELHYKLTQNKLISTLTIPPFRYHISKAGYVHRIAVINLANPSNPASIEEPDMERPKYRCHIDSRKLSEFLAP